MPRLARGLLAPLCTLTLLAVFHAPPARAVSLDQKGEMKLGVRAYTSVRIGTQHLDRDLEGTKQSQSFPYSPAGHVRQHRYFVEAEFTHDLRRLLEQGFGPLSLLRDSPLAPSIFRYKLVYRGEAEGIYDYGPREYRTADAFREIGPVFGIHLPIDVERRRLRDKAVQRHRLFQAFVDLQFSELFLRIGRQVLAWGETDSFRLLDNINPLDASFGGFLIPLDERRVPIDMVRANYYVGGIGPLSEAYVEGFLAIDKQVGFAPGVPRGSPWGLQNDSTPNPAILKARRKPPRNFGAARGGVQFKFNASLPLIGEGTFGLAHYYTYLDLPRVQTFVRPLFPVGPNFTYDVPGRAEPVQYKVRSIQTAPRVQITGATATFVIPARWARRMGLGGEPVIRTELAHFRNEARHTQMQLDPFIYTSPGAPCAGGIEVEGLQGTECTGGRLTGSSWNFVLGVDMNQYVRWLNSRNSFFFSTQFFYKHLSGAKKSTRLEGFGLMDRAVLPVAEFIRDPTGGQSPSELVFIRNPADQFLQTLAITTSYRSGTVNPNLTFFYDWSGTFVAVAGVTFIRDPFRFRIEYDYLEANRLKGASGTSLLRDRDNILFQLEYVI